MDKLKALISSDPSLTTTLLHRANRASHELQRKVTTVEHALALLGINTLRCLLLSFMVRNFLPQPDSPWYTQQKKLWSHSLATAILTRKIARRSYPELQNEGFIGGLLHDLGKVALLQALQGNGHARELAEGESLPDLVQEIDVFDTDHSLLGKRLAQKWQLPEKYIKGIWLHHQPVQSLKAMHMDSELVPMIKLADIIAHDFLYDRRYQEESSEKTGLLHLLSLKEHEEQTIVADVSDEFEDKASFFNLDDDWRTVQAQALQEAKRDLSDMVLELNEANQTLQDANRVLQISNDMALRLSRSDSLPELFAAVTGTYQHAGIFQAGIISIVDQENRLLEGSVWSGRQKAREIRIFLDQDGQPVWDSQTASIPDSLKRVISTYPERLPPPDDRRPDAARQIRRRYPLYFIPILADTELFGELCLQLDRSAYGLTEQEEMGLLQCANIIQGSLEKIRLNDKLHRRSEELSQALWQTHQQHIKLLQTERLAAVGQLAAGAAHEINNPLAIINARAQMLLLKEQDPKKENDLKQITEQIERISSILSDMMDFARPAQPEITKINLPEILNKVSTFLDNGLKKRNVSISIHHGENIPVIQADPNQLEQVFLNILLNAKHAVEEQGGSIEARTWADPESETVCVSICDDGPGIPPGNLRRIFDPFFTTKEEGKGTGLGLSTSWGIIDKHYGTLDIQSKPGKGTCVTITLPQNLAKLKASSPEKSLALAPTNQQHTVLVVDDESHIREILSEMLVAEGFAVKTAENGEEALRFLDSEAIELVLLDIRMPLTDGLTVLKTLNTHAPHVPVLIITGQANREEMRQAEAMGALKCFRKPFHIKDLLKEIRSALHMPQGNGDEPAS